MSDTPYPLYQTKIDRHAEQFAANVASMQPLLARLNEQLLLAANEGSKRTLDRHKALGKLMPRERVELLLDDDSPMLELCPLAGIEQDGYAPGSTTFACVGLICGVACVVTSNRYTLKVSWEIFVFSFLSEKTFYHHINKNKNNIYYCC
jgi:acetyl-CoA carboxylase carboxyltransferase component